MFTEGVLEAAREHARSEYPRESVGLVVDGVYQPRENVSDDPENEFIIPVGDYPEGLEAVIHSHSGRHGRSPSVADMEGQQQTLVPWGIVMVAEPDDTRGATPGEIVWFGDQVPIPPLVGRPFLAGVTDCYSLLRDYYRLELGRTPPDYPRDQGWWLEGPSMFTEERMDANGFTRVGLDALEVGDGVTFMVNSRVINHCGVYVGQGLMLHHLWNRLSRREPVGPWLRCANAAWRYSG